MLGTPGAAGSGSSDQGARSAPNALNPAYPGQPILMVFAMLGTPLAFIANNIQ